ncbi:HNH endonuclease [Priestia filamentosa]|uniref:HNH endonuclease n=1 Tax=Priestia filamentosa TaxID=1402861 RepID=UPI0002FF7154|nr:HNH endonuclease [Priestia filamentosa]
MYKQPLKYTLTDYKHVINSNHDWEHEQSADFKKKLREYLDTEFEGKCFYCQTELDQGNAAFEIDHIVHKGKYKWFTFRPENLTLSCRLCNTFKSKKETLNINLQSKKYKFVDYPQNSCDFEIIHAYIDNYDDHIELEEEVFYKAKGGSDKGKKTIEICSLHRLKLAEDKAKALLIKNQTRKQEALGLGQSITSLCDGGTQEQIDNLIRKRIEDLSDESMLLTSLINVTNNTKISNLGKKLSKFEGISLINQRDLKCLDYSLKHFDLIKNYIELLYIIENSKSIKKSFLDYLIGNRVLQYDLGPSIIFNHDIFNMVKRATNNNELKINKRVRNKFITQINTLSGSKIDFLKLDYFFRNISILLSTCETMKKILSNSSFVEYMKNLNTDLISEIQKSLPLLGNMIFHNPLLNSLSKFNIIHKSIYRYNTELINNFYRLLKQAVKLL